MSQFYRIQPEELLVVHDELDLPVGRIKLKTGGGHGGHNGLRDITTQLGSAEFHRLRVGIGHPGHRDLVHQYVLSKPSVHDRQQIYDAIDRGIAVMPFVLSGDIARAMNQLNT
ncbi:MAG: aminoacyl-tRNA hydrolase [Methylococcales bacterium]|nr:aminoacyl-tRNA hydrolase [Methylococcales bacterium]